MRLFFAIDLPDDIKHAVARAIDTIGIEDPPWRWVATDNFHITMKFLGEMPDTSVPQLTEAAEAACKNVGPFDVGLGKLGGFPSLTRPRVIFYEATGQVDVMKDLASRLNRSLASRLGIADEKRPLRAHLTIARVKRPIAPATAQLLATATALDGLTCRIQKLSLMRSHLSPQGAQYQCLKGIAL